MEQQSEVISVDVLMNQNMELSKELWTIRAHLAQREIYIIELNQHIMNLNKQISPENVDVE